jgi:hypothetical protein
MQREFATLVEQLYQQQVTHDDDLQLFKSRAYDDVCARTEYVSGLESADR